MGYKHSKLNILYLALVLIYIFPGTTFSQDGPVTLETVVVTAKKTEKSFQTGDVDQEQTTSFFTNIEREDFEGKMEDLAEIIEKEAGIQVRQSGGDGELFICIPEGLFQGPGFNIY